MVGIDCNLGWSWTKEIYGNHWEIDETKFSSVKVSHKFINNYIFFPKCIKFYFKNLENDRGAENGR